MGNGNSAVRLPGGAVEFLEGASDIIDLILEEV
jgi:hypothetical protein